MSNLTTYLNKLSQLDGLSGSFNDLNLEVIKKFDDFFMTSEQKAEIIITLYTAAIASNISRAGNAAIDATKKDWSIEILQSDKIVAEKEILLEKANLAKSRQQLLLTKEELNKKKKMLPLERAKGDLLDAETSLIKIKNLTLPIDYELIVKQERKVYNQRLNLVEQEKVLGVEDNKIVEMQKAELKKEALAEEMKDMYKKKVLTGEQQRDLIRRQSQGYKDNLLAKAAEFRGQLASFAVNVDNVHAQDRINEFNSTITALKARGNY